MRLDAVTIEFLADRDRRGCNAGTVAYYGKLLRWLGDYLASRDVTDIGAVTTRLLEDYVVSLKQRPLELRKGRLSPVTIRKWTLTMKTFFAWAHGAGRIPDDPSRLVPLPKRQQRLPKALSAEQARHLLAAPMKARERAIISLMLDSGIRLSECVGLDLADMDDDQMTFLVRKGKAGKQRVIVFAEATREQLRAWLAVRKSKCPALFVSESGQRIAADTIYKAVKAIAAAAGLYESVSPHRLRHSFVTLYLDAGGAIQDASALLGHEHISTTMIYTRIATGTLRRKHQQFSPLGVLSKKPE